MTALPSPTPLPPPPDPAWLLAYVSDVEGNDEIYILPADGGPAHNITHHPAEDRYPAWSPDDRRLAFQSNRDGNWEIYTLEIQTGQLARLTTHPAYDGAPTWSPDGTLIAFESYRDSFSCSAGASESDSESCPDLEVYSVSVTGGEPERLTTSPGGDYQPAWSPDGSRIAFTSWRDGNQEVYVLPLTGGPAQNVTQAVGDDSSPAWSPHGQELVFLSERDGTVELYRQALSGGPATRLTLNTLPEERPTLAWSPPAGQSTDPRILFARFDPGPPFEAHDPYRPGAYHLYSVSLSGGAPQPLLPGLKARHAALAPHTDLTTAMSAGAPGKAQALENQETVTDPLELQRVEDVQAPDPRLVAGVDDDFRAWRAEVLARSGHDFLGQVSDVFRPAGYYGHRLGYLSWHKTGRAVDLLFDWQDAARRPALYVVREDLAGQVYWRLFLKCALQDGSLGEPLTRSPWRFWWHFNGTGNPDPEIATHGGRRLPIPSGYFIDVTALAERYGWSRIASYHLDDFHWQRDSTATEYWHYQHTDGLTWYQAMAQIYPRGRLQELFSREIAAERGQTEAVMDGKGLPSSYASAAP